MCIVVGVQYLCMPVVVKCFCDVNEDAVLSGVGGLGGLESDVHLPLGPSLRSGGGVMVGGGGGEEGRRAVKD